MVRSPARRRLRGTPPGGVLLLLLAGCGGGGGGSSPGLVSAPPTPPRIQAIHPEESPLAGGGLLTLRGAGFAEGLQVLFGTVPAPEARRLSTAQAEARVPPAAQAGLVDLVVRNPNGGEAVLPGGFRYLPHPPPRVDKVDPPAGNARRPVPVRVTGQGFQAGARLFLGRDEVAGAAWQGAGEIAAELPPLAPARWDVTVRNPDDQSHTLPAGYEARIERDTAIARVLWGALADVYDETLEPGQAERNLILRPGAALETGPWRLLPREPRSRKLRVRVAARRETPAWQEALAALTRNRPELLPFGWGGPGHPPVQPRDAALLVEFAGDLGVGGGFWSQHPGAVRLLAIQGDPAKGPGSLLALPCSILGDARQVLVVPTVPTAPLGLPAASPGAQEPTVRLAFPLEGPDALPTLQPDNDPLLTGKDDLGQTAAIRDLRAARDGESGPGLAAGFLAGAPLPWPRAEIPVEILAVEPATGLVTVDKLGRRHTLDEEETLLQELPGREAAAGLVRFADDRPEASRAVVEVGGAAAFAPGAARLLASWRPARDEGALFVAADPPAGPGGLSPAASLRLDFGEPLAGHQALSGWVVSSEADLAVVAHPKLGTPGLVPLALAAEGLAAGEAATGLRLAPLLGLPHRQGMAERWHLHLLPEGAKQLKDAEGRSPGLGGFHAALAVDPGAAELAVGYVVRRFLAADEDGTRPGADAPDWWGDAIVKDGALRGRPFTRFQARTDPLGLAGIRRGQEPECLGPFSLFATPDHDYLGRGGLQEPFCRGGSRLQATWREDDLGLSRESPGEMHLEVEGLAVAPFQPVALVPETVDALTVRLGHADCRPDLRAWAEPALGRCHPEPGSLRSGLDPRFAANWLAGQPPVTALDRTPWLLDPNRVVKDASGQAWLPLPAPTGIFTWRDLLLDAGGGAPPLGGCLDQGRPTVDVATPWRGRTAPGAPGASFAGNRVRDHHPLALPLLIEFLVEPDDPYQGGAFTGANRFRAGYVLPPWPLPGHGLYAPEPAFRAHSSAGPDPDRDPPVDPWRETYARGGAESDGFLGTCREPRPTPPTDDHLPWLRLDLVRRVAVVTAGFLDLTQPEARAWIGEESASPGWPASWRPAAFLVRQEPPVSGLPPGTRAALQWRGAEELPGASLWDPTAEDEVARRGNLLNPLYACDADRLAARGTLPAALTGWVEDPGRLIDPATGRGPRYLCWRIVLESAGDPQPAEPWVDTLIVGFRLAPGP